MSVDDESTMKISMVKCLVINFYLAENVKCVQSDRKWAIFVEIHIFYYLNKNSFGFWKFDCWFWTYDRDHYLPYECLRVILGFVSWTKTASFMQSVSCEATSPLSSFTSSWASSCDRIPSSKKIYRLMQMSKFKNTHTQKYFEHKSSDRQKNSIFILPKWICQKSSNSFMVS